MNQLMMKLPVFCRISAQYLWRYRRRYLFLFLALGFGFGIVTVISSLKDGMEENLYLSAQSHYAGDIVAMGYDPVSQINHHMTGTEMEAVLASAEAAGLDTGHIAVRTTLMGGKEASIFFNGNEVSLKYVVGVDQEGEEDYFSKLPYADEPGPLDDDSLFLSSPIARELGARRGDSVILETLTVSGQKNTGTFVISAIVDDTSFFGYYKVYLSRQSLNRLVGFSDGDCSLIGFFLPDRKKAESGRKALYAELSSRIPAGPLVHDREAYNDETNKVEGAVTVFLLTLPVYLSEVAQLMDAIDLASLVLHGMMLLIIMVSAGVTCRLILHERIRETGTMRAIGFYESDVRLIFKLEIFAAALLSMFAGFFLSIAVNRFLSLVSFSWFPGFEIFMQNGRLNALYLPDTVALNALAVFCVLALAVWGPVFRNSRNPLPDMLSGGAV